MGYEYDADSIVHSVLILEQLLTTGGGWQDQVGGLLPGFKFSVSPNAFPVAVHTETLPVSPEFVEQVNHRLVCIYTGRQRLARSLLQDVIRHWYAREPSILQAVTDLRDNSYVCRDAILRGDLQAVGACLSNYWQSKKTMAPQSEPKFVVEMRERLGDIINRQLPRGCWRRRLLHLSDEGRRPAGHHQGAAGDHARRGRHAVHACADQHERSAGDYRRQVYRKSVSEA